MWKVAILLFVSISITKEELKYWDINRNRLVLEDGEYNVEIGKNAIDIVLSEKVIIKGEKPSKIEQKIYESLSFDELTNEVYEKTWNCKLPIITNTKQITDDSRMIELKNTFFGRMLLKIVLSELRKELKKSKKITEEGAQATEKMMVTSSLITLSMASGGRFPYNYVLAFKEISNGHLFKGIKHLSSKIKVPKLPTEDNK